MSWGGALEPRRRMLMRLDIGGRMVASAGEIHLGIPCYERGGRAE